MVRAFGRVVRPLAWSGARPRRDARTGCAFLTSIAVLTGCTAPADDGDGDGESGESVQCESGGWNRGDGGSGDEGGEDTGLGMGDDMPLPLTIGELQQGLARDGDVVAITGVVAVTPSSSSEVLPGRELFVQDPAGGAWSGLRVVAQSFDPAQRLVPGDRADLVGTVATAQGFVALVLQAPGDIVRTGTATPPAPTPVEPDTLAPGSGSARPYEGVLVRVQDAVVTDAAPCTGEFVLEHAVRVDDRFVPGMLGQRSVGEVVDAVHGVFVRAADSYELAPPEPGAIE